MVYCFLERFFLFQSHCSSDTRKREEKNSFLGGESVTLQREWATAAAEGICQLRARKRKPPAGLLILTCLCSFVSLS